LQKFFFCFPWQSPGVKNPGPNTEHGFEIFLVVLPGQNFNVYTPIEGKIFSLYE